MLLVIDIGNTNISIGIFDNENIINTYRFLSDKNLMQEDYEKQFFPLKQQYDINGCIISSVVSELNNVIKKAVDKVFDINSKMLDETLNIGLKIKTKNPQEVGADRIANACAAKALYPKPVIVVDSGSATTFDIIDKNGDFIGGLIMPGIKMQLQALYSNTSKLPKIEPDFVDKTIGDDTITSILSGVIKGSACAIDGLITQCEAEIGEKVQIIATGGYSNLIAKYMTKKFDDIDTNLTLKGLRILYNLNS